MKWIKPRTPRHLFNYMRKASVHMEIDSECDSFLGNEINPLVFFLVAQLQKTEQSFMGKHRTKFDLFQGPWQGKWHSRLFKESLPRCPEESNTVIQGRTEMPTCLNRLDWRRIVHDQISTQWLTGIYISLPCLFSFLSGCAY